jgi:hypothetical protein
MTFSSLAPDAEYMREQETAFLTGKTDNELETEYAESAKRDLKLHLQEALSLDLNDAGDLATLDEYIDDHDDRMTIALSTLLLVYRFRNAFVGNGAPMNVEKLEMWEKRYAKIRQGFPALNTSRGTASTYSIPIVK